MELLRSFEQVLIMLLIVSGIWFSYAKYSTKESWVILKDKYIYLLWQATVFTGLLLALVYVCIHYISQTYCIVLLLGLSSFSIGMKYLFSFAKKSWLAFDACIIGANGYCSYILLMHEQMHFSEYLFLAQIIFCFFVYQNMKNLAHA